MTAVFDSREYLGIGRIASFRIAVFGRWGNIALNSPSRAIVRSQEDGPVDSLNYF